VLAEINHIKTNKLDITIKKFLENDLFSQNAKFLNSSVNPSSVNDVIDFNSPN
jgi:hypothetical protein